MIKKIVEQDTSESDDDTALYPIGLVVCAVLFCPVVLSCLPHPVPLETGKEWRGEDETKDIKRERG